MKKPNDARTCRFRLLSLLTKIPLRRPDQALRSLSREGLLTERELAQFVAPVSVGPHGRPNEVLTWIMSRVARAEVKGVLMTAGGGGFQRTFTDKCCTLRTTYASMYDERDGKMPLAYVHVVQVFPVCVRARECVHACVRAFSSRSS